MITVPGTSLGGTDVTRSLPAITAEVAVSTGARGRRRRGTLPPDTAHPADRLIAKPTVASRS